MASDACPTCPTGRLPFMSALVCHTCWTVAPAPLRDVLLAAWDNIGRPTGVAEVLEVVEDDPEGWRAYAAARKRLIAAIVGRLRELDPVEEVSPDARLL